MKADDFFSVSSRHTRNIRDVASCETRASRARYTLQADSLEAVESDYTIPSITMNNLEYYNTCVMCASRCPDCPKYAYYISLNK